MSDNYRDWLKKYLAHHLSKWMGEMDKKMREKSEFPKAKNWPRIIEVELLCESCGEKVKVPFHIKRFRAMENVEWPYYMEYMSPAMKASTCPKCKNPFRMNKRTAKEIQ